MATFDAASNAHVNSPTGSATSLSGAHTVASGANKVLVAYIGLTRESGDIASPATTVTLTYNGVSMTNAATGTTTGTPAKAVGANTGGVCLFYLALTGDGASHNIVATSSQGVHDITWVAVSVNSSSGVANFTGTSGTGFPAAQSTNSPTLAVTTGSTSHLAVVGGAHGASISGTGTGTQRAIDNFTGAGSLGCLVIATNTGAATASVQFTSANNDFWAMEGICCLDAVAFIAAKPLIVKQAVNRGAVR